MAPQHTMNECIAAVCDVFKVTRSDLVHPQPREMDVKQALYAVCYVASETTGLYMAEISQLLGRNRKDWCQHNKERCRTLREHDPAFRAKLRHLDTRLASRLFSPVQPSGNIDAAAANGSLTDIADVIRPDDPPDVARMRLVVAEGDGKFRRRLLEIARGE